jgi:hypothetical protein
MKASKGFVLSLIAVSFMMLLVVMAAIMANEYWMNERVEAAPVPNSFASASLDNIGDLTANLLLPSASIAKDDNGTTISISDTLPRQIDSSQLSDLRYYAEGQLAGLQHATIDVNTDQVQNGALDLRMMDNYEFQSTMPNSSSMVFRSVGNGSSTNATSYTLSIYVDDYRGDVSDSIGGQSYSGNGAVNVTVRYIDLNGTGQTSGSLNPGTTNHLIINYFSGGMADILIGGLTQDGSNYGDALWMNISKETATYSFSARLPPQPPDSSSLIVFPVQMSYSQDGVYKIANASR